MARHRLTNKHLSIRSTLAFAPTLLASLGTIAASTAALGQSQTDTAATPTTDTVSTLTPVLITAPREAPTTFPGGQVARKGSLGILGDKDFLDTPFSTTRYTSQVVDDQQATSIAEVLTGNDPSVRASIGSSNRYDAFTIRGFRVPNSEVALNGLYGLLPNFRITPDAYERVDLIKGPSALLSGMSPGGSVGGGVNLITKRADDTPLTRATVEYASSSRKGVHLDLGRRYGDQGELGIRLNAAVREGNPPYDGQAARSSSFSLGVDYRSDRLRVSGDIIYQDDWMRAAERGYNVQAGVRVPAVPDPRLNVAQSYDFSDTQSTTFASKVEYDLTSNVMAFASTGTNKFDFDKRESPGGTIVSNSGNVSTVSTAQQGNYRTDTGEVGVRGKFAAGATTHEVTLVANRLHQTYALGQTAFPTYTTNIYKPVALPRQTVPVASTTYAVGPASGLTLSSVAAVDTWSLFQGQLQFIFGLRRQSVESETYAARTAAVTRSYDKSATTPSVAMVVRPTQQLSFYGSYIEALTAGPSVPTTAVNTSDVFAPYKTKQYELGVKGDFGGVGTSAALFQITSPSGITNPTTRIYSLDGEQRHRGLELSTFGEATKGIRLMGGLTLMDPELTHTAGGTNNGKRAVGVPRVQANLNGEWDIGALPGLTSTVRAIHTGRTYLDAANTQAIASWTRLDLGAHYRFAARGRPMVLRANVSNVFNRHHWEANPSGYLLVGSPRTLWLSLAVDI